MGFAISKTTIATRECDFSNTKGTFYCVDIFKVFKKIIDILQQKVSLFAK
jgi:hypothetical protein